MSKPWWSKKWGSNSICGITYSRLRPGKNKNGVHHTSRLKCSHSFCTNLLLEWIKKCPGEPTCPMCREQFDLLDLLKK